MIRNINSSLGEPVVFDTVDEMAAAVLACGFELSGGLREDEDYEVVYESDVDRGFRADVLNRAR